MQKITPFLWFDDQAEEAANFYVSVFKNAKLGRISRYGKEGFEVHGKPAGTVLTAEFEIDGQEFVALNGGPAFKFSEAISFQIHCKIAGGSRPLLEQARRGRRRHAAAVRLAEGKVRPFVAGDPDDPRRNAAGQGCGEGRARHERDAANEEDRYRETQASLQRMTLMPVAGALDVTPSDREVQLTRVFDAPRALVFRAFTEPSLVSQWLLGPPGWTMPVCEIDARPGGAILYVWGGPSGQEMTMRGSFREVLAPERIVHVERFDDDWQGGETIVTATFTEKAGRTTVVMTMLFASREARDGALATGMTRGTAQSYDRLAELLNSLPAAD